ncbi:MAG: signal peptidase I [Patescibacteria group bacterium]
MLKKLLSGIGNFILDTLEVVVLAVALFALGYLFIVQTHQVNGASMEPSFSDNNYLLTEKVTYYFRDPKRGETVVFKYPKAPEYDYIKRVIGLPNESILIENGEIKIFNPSHPEGVTLQEPYLSPGTKTEGDTFLNENHKFNIPQNHYIVMGDNRSGSSDSREWGLVSRSEIIGKAWIRYWPTEKLSITKTPKYPELD